MESKKTFQLKGENYTKKKQWKRVFFVFPAVEGEGSNKQLTVNASSSLSGTGSLFLELSFLVV